MSKKTVTILKQALRRKQLKNPQYTLSVLARDLKVSRAFVSSLLQGKKKLPIERLETLFESLEIDDLSQESLMEALVEDHLSELSQSSKKMANYLKKRKKTDHLKVFETYTEVAPKNFTHLYPWFNIALMDLIATHDFKFDYDWMAARLGLPVSSVKASWIYLQEKGLISNETGSWQKVIPKTRVPTRDSKAEIRAYHQSLVGKGLQVMESQTAPLQFQKRIISGLTLTANTEHLENVKTYLQSAHYQAAEDLRQGDCDEVYHMALMLYPLTKR